MIDDADWTTHCRRWVAPVLAWLILSTTNLALAEIRVIDDAGRTIVLQAPARRIISLAPNITETLFAAGAGDRIVATVRYADSPPAAKQIPRVGDSFLLDMERIAALQPDLIVVWLHGNAEHQLNQLRVLNIPIFESEPRRLADIPRTLLTMGLLAGTMPAARKAAADFAAGVMKLRERYADQSPVTVFYQIWQRPLLTVNGKQIVADVIRLCGGRNVFADQPLLVPAIDAEAVLAANPEAIVTTATDADQGSATDVDKEVDPFAIWRKLPSLRATAGNNFIFLTSDAISRQSPRILDGARELCGELAAVRARRKP